MEGTFSSIRCGVVTMKVVAANQTVSDALRNALAVRREMPNGKSASVSAAGPVPSNPYRGPFQGEIIWETARYYVQLSDGLRNGSTSVPGRICTANGHFLRNAPSCKLRVPTMGDSEFRILAMKLEYSVTSSSTVLSASYFLYSEDDPLAAFLDCPYMCYYNILGIRSVGGVPYVVQQFQTGDLWTLDRLGIWYRNSAIW